MTERPGKLLLFYYLNKLELGTDGDIRHNKKVNMDILLSDPVVQCPNRPPGIPQPCSVSCIHVMVQRARGLL